MNIEYEVHAAINGTFSYVRGSHSKSIHYSCHVSHDIGTTINNDSEMQNEEIAFVPARAPNKRI